MLFRDVCAAERRATIRGAEAVEKSFLQNKPHFPQHFPTLSRFGGAQTTNFEGRQAPLRTDQTSLRGAHQYDS
jgi:hypothetical protein